MLINYFSIRKHLNKENIIVWPSDTCYGLGVKANNEKAVFKLYEFKERAKHKPFSILVKDIEMASKYAYITKEQIEYVKKYIKGPKTYICNVKKSDISPLCISNQHKIAIRILDNKFANKLFKYIDFPITATSANLSGEKETYSKQEFEEQTKNRNSNKNVVFINFGKLKKINPSTLVDITNNEIKIIERKLKK